VPASKGYSIEYDREKGEVRVYSPPAPETKPVIKKVSKAQMNDLLAFRARFDPESQEVVPVEGP
jgi:hypothetical protein